MIQQRQSKQTVLKTILFSVLWLVTSLFQVAQAGTITYLHNDALGSAVAATNEQGEVLWQEAYRPYGERIRKEAGNTNITTKVTGFSRYAIKIHCTRMCENGHPRQQRPCSFLAYISR